MTPVSLSDSYAYCHELMRSAARNFYFGMRLLPQAKRHAMYALYGFMRLIDDIADAPQVSLALPAAPPTDTRREQLESWRSAMHRALAGDCSGHPLWPAFQDTVRRFGIPVKILDDAIDGQIQDLAQTCYASFGDLYQYCYRVASTVGIAAIHIWGFREPRAIQLAEERGVAMQLTNILRDLREDSRRGRRYLPQEDCERFRCHDWDASQAIVPAGFEDLLRFQTARAREYYERSAALEDLIETECRPTLQIMTAIYRGILDRIAAAPASVLVRRVGLSTFEKLSLTVRYAWRARINPLRGAR